MFFDGNIAFSIPESPGDLSQTNIVMEYFLFYSLTFVIAVASIALMFLVQGFLNGIASGQNE
jgi:hypothetical protein